MKELQEKIDQVANLFEELKKTNDTRLAQLEARGSADPLLTEKIEKLNAAINKIETAMARPQGSEDVKEGKGSKEYKDAFNQFVRKGVESKALSVGSDPDGGYSVVEEVSTDVVKILQENVVMRQLADVMTIGSKSLEMWVDLAGAASAWVAETGARAATATPTLGQLVFTPYELFANPQATQALLDDSELNIEAWLAQSLAEQFAIKEGEAFISGDGTGKPKGILSYAAGTAYNQVEQINSGDADEITADAIIKLPFALKAQHAVGAAFLMNRKTVGKVRTLKDGNGAYLFSPALSVGEVPSLCGLPLYQDDFMPIEAADALAVVCGNFKAGYKIVDRMGIRTLRDPYTNKPYVGFYSVKRVGGGLKDGTALKILKCAV